MFRASVLSLAAIGTIAGAADAAAIFLEYADPPGELSVVHTTAGPGQMTSTLTVSTNVNLEIDLSAFGMGATTFMNATINKTVSLGQVNEVAPGVYLADATEGFFEFLDSNNNLIVGGTYGLNGTSGAAFVLSQSGSLTTNASMVGGILEYEVGAFLQGILDANNQVLDLSAADASWTLTGISPGTDVTDEGYFADFNSNGSFSGSIHTIPAPATAAMLGLAGLAGSRRRR
ncbi:MAG: MYXO-CTERM sorting domain-containing protein [Phycisphaerales bacterium]